MSKSDPDLDKVPPDIPIENGPKTVNLGSSKTLSANIALSRFPSKENSHPLNNPTSSLTNVDLSSINPNSVDDLAKAKDVSLIDGVTSVEASSPSLVIPANGQAYANFESTEGKVESYHRDTQTENLILNNLELENSSLVAEFEKDVIQLCDFGNNSQLINYWNSLDSESREIAILNLRFAIENKPTLSDDSFNEIKKVHNTKKGNRLIKTWRELDLKMKKKMLWELRTDELQKRMNASINTVHLTNKGVNILGPNVSTGKIFTKTSNSLGLKKACDVILDHYLSGQPIIDKLLKVNMMDVGNVKSPKKKKVNMKIELTTDVEGNIKEVFDQMHEKYLESGVQVTDTNAGQFGLNTNNSDMVIDTEDNKNSHGGFRFEDAMMMGVNPNKNDGDDPIMMEETKLKHSGPISYTDKVTDKKTTRCFSDLGH
ncbi:hypothetical protein LXL04_026042 [Taraxacum kok-saghyz]